MSTKTLIEALKTLESIDSEGCSLQIEVWLDEESREQGLGDMYVGDIKDIDDGKRIVKKMVDRDCCASAELQCGDRVIFGYDGTDTWGDDKRDISEDNEPEEPEGAYETRSNIETDHTMEEYMERFGEAYDNGELWDFQKEELFDGTIDYRWDIVYWEIDGRLYETDIPFEPEEGDKVTLSGRSLEDDIASHLADKGLSMVNKDNALDIVEDIIDFYELYFDDDLIRSVADDKVSEQIADRYDIASDDEELEEVITTVADKWGINDWEWPADDENGDDKADEESDEEELDEAKSKDIRPTAKQKKLGKDDDWGEFECEHGYGIFDEGHPDHPMEVICRIDIMGVFDGDLEAVEQAKRDGYKFIFNNDEEVKAMHPNYDPENWDEDFFPTQILDTKENSKNLGFYFDDSSYDDEDEDGGDDGTCPYCHSDNIDFVDSDDDSSKYICRDCGEDFIFHVDGSVTDRHGRPIKALEEDAESDDGEHYYLCSIYGGYNCQELLADDVEVYAKNEKEAKKLAIKIYKQDYNYSKEDNPFGLEVKITSSDEDDEDLDEGKEDGTVAEDIDATSIDPDTENYISKLFDSGLFNYLPGGRKNYTGLANKFVENTWGYVVRAHGYIGYENLVRSEEGKSFEEALNEFAALDFDALSDEYIGRHREWHKGTAIVVGEFGWIADNGSLVSIASKIVEREVKDNPINMEIKNIDKHH